MLKPKDETELSDLIAGATAPLAVVGGGTQGVDVAGDPVTTRAMTGVELYEPGALTLVVRAGTPVAEVEALLAAENQQLAFEPRDLREVLGTEGAATMGGVFASNLSGPRRIQAGAARDFLLGVRFVDGAGNVVKNGGRVMKNVTGYDLVKLLAGSHGTLGVLTELSLKVLPRAKAVGTLCFTGLDAARGVALMSHALGTPFDVTGAAHALRGPDGAPVTLLRVEGFEDSVRYRLAQLQARLAEFGDGEVQDQSDMWRWVRDLDGLQGGNGNLWRISVTPGDAPGLLNQLPVEQAVMDWGGGQIWVELPAAFDLRGAMAGLSGHATLMRGTGHARFHPEPPAIAKLAAGVRARFDPRGILNPGLMG